LEQKVISSQALANSIAEIGNRGLIGRYLNHFFLFGAKDDFLFPNKHLPIYQSCPGGT